MELGGFILKQEQNRYASVSLKCERCERESYALWEVRGREVVLDNGYKFKYMQRVCFVCAEYAVHLGLSLDADE